jgi:hypothetical protein
MQKREKRAASSFAKHATPDNDPVIPRPYVLPLSFHARFDMIAQKQGWTHETLSELMLVRMERENHKASIF